MRCSKLWWCLGRHVLDVATGAKGAAFPGDDDGADRVVCAETGQRRMQAMQHLLRQGVEPVRPVERQDGDPVGNCFSQVRHWRLRFAREAWRSGVRRATAAAGTSPSLICRPSGEADQASGIRNVKRVSSADDATLSVPL